jgi:hypothetical protein
LDINPEQTADLAIRHCRLGLFRWYARERTERITGPNCSSHGDCQRAGDIIEPLPRLPRLRYLQRTNANSTRSRNRSSTGTGTKKHRLQN